MIETVTPVRGRPPLDWEHDAYAADDGPCQALARASGAHAYLQAAEPFRAGDVVQAWCEIRHHLRGWLRTPVGIERTLAKPLADLATELPLCLGVEATVGDTLMPRSLVHVLAAHGVDPRAFGAVALWRGGSWTAYAQGARIDVAVEVGDDGIRTINATIHPEGVGLWDLGAYQIALYDRLPESVARAAIGRPVADVVSHPALDELGHVIHEVTEWTGSVIHYREGRVALRDIRVEDRDHAPELP